MLTLADAREKGVCRICGEPPGEIGLLVWANGTECRAHHGKCLDTLDRLRGRETELAAIREKLQRGLPPLDDAECCLLYSLATGESILRRKRCPECEGTGFITEEQLPLQKRMHLGSVLTESDLQCHTCNGEGYVKPCPKCHGWKLYGGEPCDQCKGEGYVQ